MALCLDTRRSHFLSGPEFVVCGGTPAFSPPGVRNQNGTAVSLEGAHVCSKPYIETGMLTQHEQHEQQTARLARLNAWRCEGLGHAGNDRDLCLAYWEQLELQPLCPLLPPLAKRTRAVQRRRSRVCVLVSRMP